MTVVILMVSYWFYKFEVEDRDIGVVDYLSFDEAKGVELPAYGICFNNPVLDKRIKEVSPNTSTESYLEYLNGDNFDEKFELIDYENVTIDFTDYRHADWRGTYIEFTNGTLLQKENSYFKHEVIFNGFFRKHWFLKCFSFLPDKEKLQNIKNVYYYFDKQKLFWHLAVPLRQSRKIYTTVYYPGQFLLEVNPLVEHSLNRNHGGLNVVIEGIEILKRRQTHNRQCKEDGRFYDDLVRQRHIESVGCRSPYLIPHQTFPICKNKQEIKNSKYEFTNVRRK